MAGQDIASMLAVLKAQADQVARRRDVVKAVVEFIQLLRACQCDVLCRYVSGDRLELRVALPPVDDLAQALEARRVAAEVARINASSLTAARARSSDDCAAPVEKQETPPASPAGAATPPDTQAPGVSGGGVSGAAPVTATEAEADPAPEPEPDPAPESAPDPAPASEPYVTGPFSDAERRIILEALEAGRDATWIAAKLNRPQAVVNRMAGLQRKKLHAKAEARDKALDLPPDGHAVTALETCQQRRIAKRLFDLPYDSNWTPARDHALARHLARGDGLGATAEALHVTPEAARARWQVLNPMVGDLDYQRDLLIALRMRDDVAGGSKE